MGEGAETERGGGRDRNIGRETERDRGTAGHSERDRDKA